VGVVLELDAGSSISRVGAQATGAAVARVPIGRDYAVALWAGGGGTGPILTRRWGAVAHRFRGRRLHPSAEERAWRVARQQETEGRIVSDAVCAGEG
jgi:hypothetical protein